MRWAICALLSLALASCGGGGTFASGGVGTGGTGISSGTVTGFGSVVVDGTAYSSATPQYFNGNDQEDAALAPSTAVQLGDQLRVQLDAQGNPSTVIIEPDLIGAVADLNNTPAASANGFTVNGVGVRVNNKRAAGPVTYYSGLAGYGDLSSGMQVEVHGAYGIDAGGGTYIQATLIEQLPSSNPVTRITGVVSNLDSAADTFQIGNTSVQFSASTALVPSGASLANGQLVNVWSNVSANANGAIVAGAIRIRTLQGLSGSAQIGGLVSMLAGKHFQVSGVPIDASAPGLASALLALADGEYVVVQGQVDPTTGVVKASSIRPYSVQPAQVELRGTITAYVSPSNFLVRGVPVDASQVNPSPSGATLGNGVFVDIVGSIGSGTGNVVTASAVTVLSAPPDGGTVDYQGTVSNLDTAHGTFTLTWQREGGIPASSSVTLAPNVVYSNGTASQLTNGANVEIEATNTAGGLLAYSVSFRNTGQSSGSGTTETSGVVYNYAAGASSFQINGLTITIPSNVSVPTGFGNGVKAEVSFTTSGGENVAQRIGIDH